MARKGGGLRAAVNVIKAIDRANKQAARNAENGRKQTERERAKRMREHEKMLRERERERRISEKEKIDKEKKRLKDNLEKAQNAHDSRCNARKALRIKYTNQELR